MQDIEQAKSLLKQAGYDNNLTVELVTSAGALGGDEVAAAQVFAEQAKAAGVTVNIKKTDSASSTARTTCPGRSRRTSGRRAASWRRPARARCPMRRTTRPTGRTPSGCPWSSRRSRRSTTPSAHELIAQAQQIEFDTGGYIIWSWRNQVDAYSKTTTGYKLDKLGGPIGRMYFKDVYFV